VPAWPPEIEPVREALELAYRNGDWGRYEGPFSKQLDQELADLFGVRYVATCSSGTLAVELALCAVGIRPGDEVVLAAYDYPGNFLSVHAIGARPVLVDVHGADWNMDAGRVEAAIGPATRAILVSHLHGSVVRMPEVVELAERRGLAVVEDIAQVPGGRVAGRLAGQWGQAAAASFGGSKLLSAGRGGAVLTSDRLVYQRLRLASQRYNQLYCLSELQAAVLLPQLELLGDWNERRRRNADRLSELLGELPGLEPIRCTCPESAPCYYKLGIKFDGSAWAGMSRAEFITAAVAEGVELGAGFPAAHLGRSTARYRAPEPLPNASDAHERLLLLHHPVLLGDAADIEAVAAAFAKIHRYAEQIVSELRE
jgi:dTDP-4-amino-4,6-dideoxygalactose transaminase